MAGRHSRNKGNGEERAIVNLLRSHGVEANRTLTSGARNAGEHTYDLDIYPRGKDNAEMIGECKLRGDGFGSIYKWLANNDFLTIRADRQERLWVFPERIALELLTANVNKGSKL